MKSAELRTKFLEFFKRYDHRIVASYPLVPPNDPTLLFTNAGMVQFKEVFLGQEKRPYARVASCQRCVRAGGKHNDLENVGYTARHHTFFEMLGNFSFGDYFKREAIGYAWEFLVKELGLPPERLWVTVYKDDDEAADIWLKEIGVDNARFVRLGEKDNFWAMGDTGPCGPCSEIYYDHGEGIPGSPPGSSDEDSDRYVEIWNLVFMQYNRDLQGKTTPLPKPSVDTGMGLERMAAVMQGVHSNYEIDLFRNLIRAAARETHIDDLSNNSLKVIADHIRACSFLIVDGVIPGNEGRGYVLRRIIRRAIRHGYKLGQKTPFFHKLVNDLVTEMGDVYPELSNAALRVIEVLRQEEERFYETIENGMRILETDISDAAFVVPLLAKKYGASSTDLYYTSSDGIELDGTMHTNKGRVAIEVKRLTLSNASEISNAIYSKLYKLQEVSSSCFQKLILVLITKDKKTQIPQQIKSISVESIEFEVLAVSEDELQSFRVLSGENAFRLHDTYGFPLDLTADICRERNVVVDEKGFEKAMQRQREQARAASSFKIVETGAITVDQPTQFTGYERLSDEGEVLQITRGTDLSQTNSLRVGEQGNIVLDSTPFYAESGGQVGDRGVLHVGMTKFRVDDTQKIGQVFVHKGRVEAGAIKIGDVVTAEVEASLRWATMRNHSATHLMHKALRDVLGPHVQQKGSLVDEERTRFDFSHNAPLTPDQIAEVERRVNEQILLNEDTRARITDIDTALAEGVMALFGEKYGTEVRVLNIGDSIELCGGTHVRRTGDIGLFKIISEGGVAAGVRRIEAVTGEGALKYVAETEAQLQRIAELVRANREEAAHKVEQLQSRLRGLEKELEQLRSQLASGTGEALLDQVREVKGIKVLAARLDGADAKSLREAVDRLKDKLAPAAVVLAAVSGKKVMLIAGVTKDLTKRIRAGDLANAVAAKVGGKGGGRPDMAQAGGTDPSGLESALASVPAWIEQHLK